MSSLLSSLLYLNKKRKCESVFTSPRWLAKLRQKPSSSPTNICIQEPISYNKEVDSFEKSYLLAIEELNYAIESQGSIYYHGDLVSSTEAVHHCFDKFNYVLRLLQPTDAHFFQKKWSAALYQLQLYLNSLPKNDSESF
ncbi:hypothetical protein BY458DRAFT_488654 [Sporodiniella umbellata]|nr:hypothetical protein BY458DRAFT_488654 [Sporodiniella umbellata]